MKPILNLVAIFALSLCGAACSEEPELVEDSDNADGIFPNLLFDEMVYVEGGTFLMGVQTIDSLKPNYLHHKKLGQKTQSHSRLITLVNMK